MAEFREIPFFRFTSFYKNLKRNFVDFFFFNVPQFLRTKLQSQKQYSEPVQHFIICLIHNK